MKVRCTRLTSKRCSDNNEIQDSTQDLRQERSFIATCLIGRSTLQACPFPKAISEEQLLHKWIRHSTDNSRAIATVLRDKRSSLPRREVATSSSPATLRQTSLVLVILAELASTFCAGFKWHPRASTASHQFSIG